MTAHLLGIDPGLATCGWALLGLEPVGAIVDGLGCLRTKPDHKRTVDSKSMDNVRRCQLLFAGLDTLVVDHTPIAICIEAQSWPRNAAATAAVAQAWGVIATVAALRQVPLLQVPPQQIKAGLTGSRKASKLQVQAALEARYGALPLPPNKTDHEHACDALGACVACLPHPTVLAVRRVLGGDDGT